MEQIRVALPQQHFSIPLDWRDYESLKKEYAQKARDLLKKKNLEHVLYGYVSKTGTHWFGFKEYNNDVEFQYETDQLYSTGEDVRIFAVHRN